MYMPVSSRVWQHEAATSRFDSSHCTPILQELGPEGKNLDTRLGRSHSDAQSVYATLYWKLAP